MLQDGEVVLLVGRVDTSRGAPQLIVDKVVRPEDAARELATCLEITFVEGSDATPIDRRMELVAGILKQARAVALPRDANTVEVMIVVVAEGQRVELRTPTRIAPEAAVLARIAEVVGAGSVTLRADGPPKVATRKPAGARRYAASSS